MIWVLYRNGELFGNGSNIRAYASEKRAMANALAIVRNGIGTYKIEEFKAVPYMPKEVK